MPKIIGKMTTTAINLMTCDACENTINGRVYHGRRIVRSGRNREAIVQTIFCRNCAQSILGLRLPPLEYLPLTASELAALEREARKPNRGCQYFTANDVLRLIATLVSASWREETRVGVPALPGQLRLLD
jgi:hypothetical protein